MEGTSGGATECPGEPGADNNTESMCIFNGYISKQHFLFVGLSDIADYQRISFSKLSINNHGIYQGLKVLLKLDAGSIIRTTPDYVTKSMTMPTKRSFFQNSSRQDLLEYMTPVCALETLSDLSEKFVVTPMKYRVAALSTESAISTRSDVIQIAKIEFQVPSRLVDEVIVTNSFSLWLMHSPKYTENAPTTFDFKTNQVALTEKSVFVFVKLSPEQKEIPLGSTPPVWPNENGDFPLVNEKMAIINGKVYFVNKRDIFNRILINRTFTENSFHSNHKVTIGLTFIGKVNQFIKSLRMFTLSDLPPERTPAEDYNVCPLFDIIVKNLPLAHVDDYQPEDSFFKKFRYMMHAKEPRILVLDGAPGTGKSSKTVGVVVDYIQLCLDYNLPLPHILVTAPSNAAADILFMKLHNNLKRNKNVYVQRVGEKHKFGHEVLTIEENAELEFKEAAINLAEENGEFLSETAIKRAYLQRANIIVSTLGSTQCNDLTTNRQQLNFELLIVDECGQSNFAEFLFPFHFTGIQKLLLMGDPKQLGPVIKWIGFYSYQPNETSVFVHLYERIKREDPEAVIVLREQYRMRKAVAEIVSSISYNNYRTDALVQAERGNWEKTLSLPEIIVFSGDSWQEKQSTRSFSYESAEEAKFGMLLLEASLKQAGFDYDNKCWPCGVQQLKYSIISLYLGQVYLFTRLLKEQKLEDFVTVSTVDQMQGSETDVAIVSAVRASNGTLSVGFAADIRRLTVALSRAACVYVLANFDSFREEVGWQQLFHLAAQHERAITWADSFESSVDLLKLLAEFSAEPIYKGH